MPIGQYERKKRGRYKIADNTSELNKRVLYLTDDQYYSLKELAEKRDVTYSKLIRIAIDEYLEKYKN